ncbi:MAG: outer membrane beta-barrel protein [Gemmatimonadetes bacterium]|nr:outer membrane beta-barrel protein [Gemmatimonadota bacterium]
MNAQKPIVVACAMTICLILVSVTEAAAQEAQDRRTSGWYVSVGLGGSLVSGLDQVGWNTESTCYPTSACFDLILRPDIPGYRWRYDPSTDRGIGFDAAVGRVFDRTRLEVSFAHRRNNVDQGALIEITYLDGTSAGASSSLGLAQAASTNFFEDLVTSKVTLNAYYDLPFGPRRITPYVGVGTGIAFVELTRIFFSIEYSDPSGSGTLYDPPLSFYNSKQDTRLSDTVFAGHVYAGADYSLNDRAAIGLKVAYSRVDDVEHTGTYEYHPYFETDPSFTNLNTFSATNHWSLTLNVRVLFGN